MKLRLLSWNVHGLPSPLSKHRATRLGRIALRILEDKPDVLALQEAWAGSVRILTDALSDYSPCFVRTRAGGARGGLMCLVRRNKDIVTDAASVRFRRFSASAPRHRVWEADGLAGKGALFVRIERAGEPCWIVTTHLQSRYRGSPHAVVRGAQLHELHTWVGELGVASTAIVAGDFNTPAEDPLYELVTSIGTDLTEEVRKATGAATNYSNHSTSAWIDYLLAKPAAGHGASASLNLIPNRGVDDPYSDHTGLLADIETSLATS